MSNPFFSIVITCHNYEKYISFCIKSVLNQDFRDFEIIAVNAGSTDLSQTIIDSFKEITKVWAPKGSHSVSCMRGFKECRGKWILFLDADDFLFSSALSTIRNVVRPELSKIQFNLRICNEKGVFGKREVIRFPSFYNSKSIEISYERSGTYIWPVTSGNVYLSSFVKQVFPLKDFLPPDGQLNTIAPAFGQIGQINSSLGCYRLHGHNIDNRNFKPWDVLRFQKNIKRRYQELHFTRRKALFLNKRFPLKRIIDDEITFISYRIFLKKLKVAYFFSSKDNFLILYVKFLRYILFSGFSPSFILLTTCWYLLFLISPVSFCRMMLKQRFSR